MLQPRHLVVEYVVTVDDTEKKKHPKGGTMFFCYSLLFSSVSKGATCVLEAKQRGESFWFCIRFTISRLVITCTVRELSNCWTRDLLQAQRFLFQDNLPWFYCSYASLLITN